MPVYEYVCTSCGHKFEQSRSFGGDEKDLKCPECGAESPRRIFSVFGSSSSSGMSCAPRHYG